MNSFAGQDAAGDRSSTATGFFQPHPGAEPAPGFRLETHLGGGGVGEVWTAMTPQGFLAALKLIRLDAEAAQAESRALEIIKDIQHPNLIRIHGSWRIHDYLVIAMELAERTVLDRFHEATRQGLRGIPREELLFYMDEAAKGIDFLNEACHRVEGRERVAIQHRDVKPGNILLIGYRVKLADFGLVRVLTHSVTAHSNRGWTFAYAPPEFFRGQTAGQSDQYSLAVTYCHLRGGRLPFNGNPGEIMAGHLQGEPDLTMLPSSEQEAVARALAKNPKDRWPSCQAFVKAVGADPAPSELEAPADGSAPAVPEASHATPPQASAVPTDHPRPEGPRQAPAKEPAAKARDAKSRPLRPRPRGRRRYALMAAAAFVLVAGAALGSWKLGWFSAANHASPGNAATNPNPGAQPNPGPGPAQQPTPPPTAATPPTRAQPPVTAPSFQLILPSVDVVLRAGCTVSFPVTVTRQGANGVIDVTLNPLPAGVTQTPPVPVQIQPGDQQAQVTLQATAQAALGTRPIGVTAQAGSLHKSGAFRLTVKGKPTLVIRAPQELTLTGGEEKSFSVEVQRTEVTGDVTVQLLLLEVPPRPVGLKEPVSIRDGQPSAQATVVVDPAFTHGELKAQLVAQGGGTQAVSPLKLIIRARPRLDLVLPPTVAVKIGQTVSIPVTIRRTNAADPVTFQARSPVKYLTWKIAPNPGQADAATVELTALEGADVGRVPVTVIATAGNLEGRGIVMVIVDGDRDRAFALYKPAIDLYYDGVLKNEPAKFQQAIDACNEALRFDPRLAEAYDRRGMAYAHKDNPKRDLAQAIADHTEAIKLEPNTAHMYQHRGLAYEAKGDQPKAIQDYTTAIAKAKEKKEKDQYYQNLANAYGRLGNFQKRDEILRLQMQQRKQQP